MTWTLQGLWVLITIGAALAAMASDQSVPLGPFALVGGALWLLGFILEVIADGQKRAFRRDPGNEGAFIQSGLWALCRHPNYLGEILLWLGVALVAVPVLSGWQQLTLLSPVFVYVLLTRISGIPLLASRGKRRWGNDPAYQAYLDRTPVLFPRPLGRVRSSGA
jgi:steroid 5-alpha reductase family enzyme